MCGVKTKTSNNAANMFDMKTQDYIYLKIKWRVLWFMIFLPHHLLKTLVFSIPIHSAIDYFHPKFKLTHRSIHPSAERSTTPAARRVHLGIPRNAITFKPWTSRLGILKGCLPVNDSCTPSDSFRHLSMCDWTVGTDVLGLIPRAAKAAKVSLCPSLRKSAASWTAGVAFRAARTVQVAVTVRLRLRQTQCITANAGRQHELRFRPLHSSAALMMSPLRGETAVTTRHTLEFWHFATV